jgi:uncharacterized damage-inducible protein DinB
MHPYLIPGLSSGPAVLRHLLTLVPRNQLDVPTHPGRFTVREVVAHLADWEPILRARVEGSAGVDGFGVVPLDEEVRAVEQGYGDWDIDEALAKFAHERAQTIETVQQISEPAWSHVAHHPERGALSTADLAWVIVGHDNYHLVQTAQFLDLIEVAPTLTR